MQNSVCITIYVLYFFQVIDPECSVKALRRRITRSGLYICTYILYTSYTQFKSSNCDGLISVWMKCEFKFLFLFIPCNICAVFFHHVEGRLHH
jgi:hypothetical protein